MDGRHDDGARAITVEPVTLTGKAYNASLPEEPSGLSGKCYYAWSARGVLSVLRHAGIDRHPVSRF